MKRPARCYSKIDRPAYTRKKYIKGGPDSKIRIFTLGNKSEDFEVEVALVANQNRQITMEALEATRINVNRYLTRVLGRENYFLKIIPYPHAYIRENKMMTGAGADRVQDGMRKAFGKPIGRVARVKKNQPLIRVKVDRNNVEHAKEALRRGRYRFPTTCRIIILKGQELVK
ncbi:MAG: 50S ribosomal protein L16 [Promethearchaeota archaeon]